MPLEFHLCLGEKAAVVTGQVHGTGEPGAVRSCRRDPEERVRDPNGFLSIFLTKDKVSLNEFRYRLKFPVRELNS